MKAIHIIQGKHSLHHIGLEIVDTHMRVCDDKSKNNSLSTNDSQPYQLGSQINVSITTNDVDITKETFDKSGEGGQVAMPLQETFWSPAYGSVIDKFGIT